MTDGDVTDADVLVILGPDAVSVLGSGGDTTTTAVSGTQCGGEYVVVAGDFMASIADRFGTTVDAIVMANAWADGLNHV